MAPSGFQNTFSEALRHHQGGRLADAEQRYQAILHLDPAYADALHLLGVLNHQGGRYARAALLIGRAIAISCQVPAFHSNLAIVLQAQGKGGDAVASYRRALIQYPDYIEALYNLGNVQQCTGSLDAALATHRRTLFVKPDLVEAHCSVAKILKGQGRLVEALASGKCARILRPEWDEAYSVVGLVLQDCGNLESASSAYARALILRPDAAETRYNLGLALKERGLLLDAIESYQQALTFKPDLAEAHCNLGVAYKAKGLLTDASASYRRALVYRPNYPEAHSNLGIVLQEEGDLPAAARAYERALIQNPDHVEAHLNRGLLLLLRGRFDEGWPEHEWRWKMRAMETLRRKFDTPPWHGEELNGRTIFLYAEQGMGDSIQFCRYVPMVAARGGRVILEVPRPMRHLLATLDGVDRLIANGDILPSFDCYCSLMGLLNAFSTQVATIPAPVPFIKVDPDRVAFWRGRIGDEGYRVGIVWQGNPQYKADRYRSAPLAAFAPLAKIPGVRLISLQRVHGLDQLTNLPIGMTVETLGPDFDAGDDAFRDTAAVIMTLDLVIAIDSAVVHVAGTLGRPTWLPLARVPHWVWLLDRDDTPWYPTIRLFRQRRQGDWGELFERMATWLRPRGAGRE